MGTTPFPPNTSFFDLKKKNMNGGARSHVFLSRKEIGFTIGNRALNTIIEVMIRWAVGLFVGEGGWDWDWELS